MTSRGIGLATVGLSVSLVVAAAGSGEAKTTAPPGLSIRITASPTTVNVKQKPYVTYTLQLFASTPQRFNLAVESSLYESSPGWPEGSPIRPVAQGRQLLAIAGNGVTTGRMRITHGLPTCSPVRNLFHGYEQQALDTDLAMEAGANASISVRYRIGRFARWPGLAYGPTVFFDRRLQDGTFGTIGRSYTIKPPKVAVKGLRTGVRIAFTTTPRSSPRTLRRVRSIRRGTPITIRGHTRPALRRKLIDLKYTGPTSGRYQLIGRARTDRRGRFALRGWRPKHAGHYEVWAFYRPRAKRSRVVGDHACPRAFILRR